MDTSTTPQEITAVAVASPVPPEVLEQVLIGGDLAGLTEAQRLAYYRAVCQSLGLNPLSKPFEYLWLDGKLRLYALRDCADQLRRLHGISITITGRERLGDIYVVTARAKDRTGREDESIGAVALGSLKRDALANAFMKAETKAKRRVTLSLAGLGWLDETEVETISRARPGETAATPEPPAEVEGQVSPAGIYISRDQARELKRAAQTVFGFAGADRRLREDLGLAADERLTLMRPCARVPVEQYQTLMDGYEAVLRQEQEADGPG
jgi:hypothetical protein